MSSDEASSRVTYTSISSDYEEPSDAGSPGVIVYGYDGLPMHPIDPPSPDYVPDPEKPEQAPLLLDYEDPKDESEDGPVDYPVNGGDDDDDESSGDDADDEASKEDEEEEEEHLAPANSTAAASPVVDPVPSAEETEPFETDESAAIPPPPTAYRTTARMSIRAQAPIPFPSEDEVDRLLAIPTPPPSPLTSLSSPLPQIPSPPLPVPSPLATSPTYAEAPFGFRAAGIRLRAASPLPSPTSPPTHHPLPLPPPSSPLLPLVDRKEDIHEADIPPRKRLCLTAPTLRFEEGASTTLEGVNVRVIELAETHKRDTQDLYAHLEDAQDSRTRLSGRVDTLLDDRQFHQQTVILIEDEARVSREAWAQAMGCSTAALQARDPAHADDPEDADSSSTAKMPPKRGTRTRTTPATATATTTNPMTDAAIRALIAQGVADALVGRPIQRNTNPNDDGSQGSGSGITRPVRPTHECTYNDFLKCQPLNFKGTEGVVGLTQYGTPMSRQLVMMPLTDAIEFVTELMDKKICTLAERQIENKRKQDENFRNNQNQQQQNKRQNTGRAYTVGPSEKRQYGGSLPKCSKNANADNNQRATGTNQQGGNGNAPAKVYMVGNMGTNPDSNVVTSKFLLNNHYASILFDTGADRSFVSTVFSSLIDITPTTLDHYYDVELADGKIIRINTIIRGCTLNFLNHPFNIDLMSIELGSFDVIIGMDWLAKCW
ncbi:putative reverse transcriptase domain-containing protein [Tanacetum coccineum]